MKKKLLPLIRFWLPNGLLLLVMAGSGIMYFTQPDMAAEAFRGLGYPVYSMYFNAVAKLLGALALVLPVFPQWIKEFAYAGYLYIILLATQAIYVMPLPGSNAAFMLIFVALWAWAYWEFRRRA